MPDFRKARNLSARMDCECNPNIIKLHKGQQVKNAVDTGDDDPIVGNTWIDYWKTFTMQDTPDVCPLCGNPMADCVGCHVLIKSQSIMSNGNYETTEYIIPGHQKCNCQYDEEFDLKIAIKTVEAIKK